MIWSDILEDNTTRDLMKSGEEIHCAEKLNDDSHGFKRRGIGIDEETRRKQDVNEENLEAKPVPELLLLPILFVGTLLFGGGTQI